MQGEDEAVLENARAGPLHRPSSKLPRLPLFRIRSSVMARALPYLLLVLFACGRAAAPPKVPPAPEAAAMEPAPAAEPESVVARRDAEALGCPPVFPASVRASWQDISGERYRIDASGRPEQAVAMLPPIAAEERNGGGGVRGKSVTGVTPYQARRTTTEGT